MIKEATDVFLLAFPALLSILNPFGGAFVFLAATAAASVEQRRSLARTVATYCTFLLFGAFFLGTYILEFFGISLPVMRLAGGLVIATTAWQIMKQPDISAADAPPPMAVAQLGQRAFYPLTMPLTVGPGTISAAIALGSARPAEPQLLLGFVAGAAVAMLLSCALIYYFYSYADRVSRLIGATGTSIVMRLSAFILLCIGFQVGWVGVEDLVLSLMRR